MLIYPFGVPGTHFSSQHGSWENKNHVQAVCVFSSCVGTFTLNGFLQELKKEAKNNKALVDTLNEVGSAFLELVPWRAREGLDKMITEDNERYRLVSDTISQKVDEIDAAILRSQQVQKTGFWAILSCVWQRVPEQKMSFNSVAKRLLCSSSKRPVWMECDSTVKVCMPECTLV